MAKNNKVKNIIKNKTAEYNLSVGTGMMTIDDVKKLPPKKRAEYNLSVGAGMMTVDDVKKLPPKKGNIKIK